MINYIQRKRNKKGFTLIELVVVLAILGILAAVAIPRFNVYIDEANKTAVETNLRTIDSAIILAVANGKEVKDLNSLVQAGTLASVPKAPDGVTYSIKVIDGQNRAVVTIQKNTFGEHDKVTEKNIEQLTDGKTVKWWNN